MKNTDQIPYLTTLLNKVNELLKLLEKQKPGSAYSKTEIRAFTAFPMGGVKLGLKALRLIQKEESLIPLLEKTKREDAIYFLQNVSQRILESINALRE